MGNLEKVIAQIRIKHGQAQHAIYTRLTVYFPDSFTIMEIRAEAAQALSGNKLFFDEHLNKFFTTNSIESVEINVN